LLNRIIYILYESVSLEKLLFKNLKSKRSKKEN